MKETCERDPFLSGNGSRHKRGVSASLTELRSICKTHFNTQKHLAGHLKISEGRLSQILSGRETMSYETLTHLLVAVPNLAERDRLYQLWRSDFAPGPFELKADDSELTDEHVIAVVNLVDQFVNNGQRRRAVFEYLLSIWRRLSKEDARYEIAMIVGEALVDQACALASPIEGIPIATEMTRLARAHYDPPRVARSLWRKSISQRLLDPMSQLLAKSTMNEFRQYLDAWQPRCLPEVGRRNELVHACVRDSALAKWDAHRRYGGDSQSLRFHIATLQKARQHTDSLRELSLNEEVEVRLLVQIGELEPAEVRLDHAAQIKLRQDDPHWLKLKIAEIRLLIAEGQVVEAERRIRGTVATAEELDLLHYHHELTSLEGKLV